MEITTKFYIGDEVYLLRNNRVTIKKIISIDISIEKEYEYIPHIRYEFNDGSAFEEQCFASKQELINSL